MSARICALFGLILLVAPATAHEYSRNGVMVVHPWARATPGGAKVGSAYFAMKAHPGHADRLIGARTEAARTVELHNQIMENGIAKMRRVESIVLPAGTSVILRPGGYHVMLLDLVEPLKEGDLLNLTLVFEKAGAIEVEATIEPVGATGPHGFADQPDAQTQPAHKH